jgi:dipeptidyl-peptidase-3
LYLCTNKELLSVFGYEGQEVKKLMVIIGNAQAEDIFYVNWLIMVRAGLRALEFFTPSGNKWGQGIPRKF